MIYAKLCGKCKGNYNGDAEIHDIDTDNNRKDDDIEGFDGFIGDINIINSLQIEAV